MEKEIIINKTIEFVKDTLKNSEGGHDWWHIYRVWKNAQNILKNETGADYLTVELGALLHDIADSKFHNGNEDIGPKTARDFLLSLKIDNGVISHVENIIRHISFKQSFEGGRKFKSLELDIVQDADRLDALGAIGVARAFNYGGYKNRPFYNPEIEPNLNMTKEEYKKNVGTTINHFYEKLILLKDLMNTGSGKILAEKRHEFLENYLNQFHAEWNGEV